MKPYRKPEIDIPRRIVRLLSVTGISVVIAMVSLTIWMSRSVDDISTEFYQKMVMSTLEDQVHHLDLLTEKDTHWGTGLNWILSGNSQSISANIGASTTQSHEFDLSFIFGAQDEVLYAFEDGGQGSDGTLEQPYFADDFIKAVRATPVVPHTVVSGFVIFDGQLGVAAAARFESENPDMIPSEEMPILLNFIMFKQDVLDEIATERLLPDISISLRNTPPSSSVSVPLFAGTGNAHFVWENPPVGHMLLTRSLGAITAVCLLTALGHLLVGRITLRLAKAYKHESREARNDRLTGLLNRAGLEEELDSDRIAMAMGLNRLALVLLDMDHFKDINDTYGHAAGDKALQQMSLRLRSIVPQNGIVARMGGDEFLILIIDDSPQVVADLVTARLAEAGRKPETLGDGIDVHVEASMGVAIAKQGRSMRQLMMAADSAMYEAKTARAFWQDSQKSSLNEDVAAPDGSASDAQTAATRSA